MASSSIALSIQIVAGLDTPDFKRPRLMERGQSPSILYTDRTTNIDFVCRFTSSFPSPALVFRSLFPVELSLTSQLTFSLMNCDMKLTSVPLMSLFLPPQPHRIPTIFSRIGDEDSEELVSLTAQASVRCDLSRAKRDFDSAKQEFLQVQRILEDTSGAAVTLAGSLSRGISSTPEHGALRIRTAVLILQLEEINFRLSEAKKLSESTTLSQIERERIESASKVEGLRRNLTEMQNRIRMGQTELFGIISSENWERATAAETERQISDRIYKFVTAEMKQLSADPPITSPTKSETDPRRIRPIQRRLELEKEVSEATQERTFAQTIRKVRIATLLDDIARFDAALRSLGEEGLNLKELERQHLPEGPLAPLKRPSSSAGVGRSPMEGMTVQLKRPNSDLKKRVRRLSRV
jgi:hypothetical protein